MIPVIRATLRRSDIQVLPCCGAGARGRRRLALSSSGIRAMKGAGLGTAFPDGPDGENARNCPQFGRAGRVARTVKLDTSRNLSSWQTCGRSARGCLPGDGMTRITPWRTAGRADSNAPASIPRQWEPGHPATQPPHTHRSAITPPEIQGFWRCPVEVYPVVVPIFGSSIGSSSSAPQEA